MILASVLRLNQGDVHLESIVASDSLLPRPFNSLVFFWHVSL